MRPWRGTGAVKLGEGARRFHHDGEGEAQRHALALAAHQRGDLGEGGARAELGDPERALVTDLAIEDAREVGVGIARGPLGVVARLAAERLGQLEAAHHHQRGAVGLVAAHREQAPGTVGGAGEAPRTRRSSSRRAESPSSSACVEVERPRASSGGERGGGRAGRLSGARAPTAGRRRTAAPATERSPSGGASRSRWSRGVRESNPGAPETPQRCRVVLADERGRRRAERPRAGARRSHVSPGVTAKRKAVFTPASGRWRLSFRAMPPSAGAVRVRRCPRPSLRR